MEDLTSSPETLDTTTDKLAATQKETPELRFPTIQLDTSLESLMSCSQPSSSTATIMPDKRSSATGLDDSWTKVDPSDCAPDDDVLSEQTDAASTLDMNSTGDCESIVAETDDESITAEVKSQGSHLLPDRITSNSDSGKVHVDGSHTTEVETEAVKAPHCRHTPTKEEFLPSCVNVSELILREETLMDALWELISPVPLSAVGNILCALLVTMLACLITDFVSTHRPVVKPAPLMSASSSLIIPSSTVSHSGEVAVTTSIVVSQNGVINQEPAPVVTQTIHLIRTQDYAPRSDESMGEDTVEADVWCEPPPETTDTLLWLPDRPHTQQAAQIEEDHALVATPERSGVTLRIGSWSVSISSDDTKRPSGVNASRYLHIPRALGTWVMKKTGEIMSRLPLHPTAHSSVARDRLSQMVSRFRDGHIFRGNAGLSVQDADQRTNMEQHGTAIQIQTSDSDVKGLSVTTKRVQAQAQALIYHMHHHTRAVLNDAVEMSKVLDTGSREYRQKIREALTSLYADSVEICNGWLTQVGDIKDLHRKILLKAQRQARNIVAD